MHVRFTFLILCILLGSRLGFAQYSDEQLYDSYVKRDMQVWYSFIATSDWYHLSNPEKLRQLHYEFGLTAYALNNKWEQGRELLDQYEHHLAEMQPCLSKAMFLLYDGAAHSYELNWNRSQVLKHGPVVVKIIDQALALDPNNPYIIAMRGQVEFYSPFGSNKKALSYLQQADSIYHLPDRPYYKWNARAAQMALLNCMVKCGMKDEAVTKAKYILKNEEPNFMWIKNEFLPANH